MRSFPLSLIESIFWLPFMRRPALLAQAVSECPSPEELGPNLIFVEIRGGHPKWAHIACPKCGDHIQLPLAGKERWSLEVDLLRRPTLAPSIWETESCGAHFFVRKGDLVWCRERPLTKASGRTPSSGSGFKRDR
jgi:hypothetical protein